MIKILATIVRLYFYAFASWVIVHSFALLGVFGGLGFIPWWLIFPRQTPCLLCRALKEGEYCHFCRRPVSPLTDRSPKTFTSAAANSFLIIILSVFALGIVYTENIILTRLGIFAIPKTVAFTLPATGQYKLEEVFEIKIGLNGIKEAVNAVQADLKFDANVLEAVDINTNDSFATIFVEKEIDNSIGFARLTGGLPNPGYQNPDGVFCSVYFRGKLPGVAKVELLPSSLVLANNGQGSNLLNDLPSASYLIRAERISWEEKNRQENLLSAHVLGEKTTAQMYFYDEKTVLGETSPEVIPVSKPSVIDILMEFEKNLNEFTLSFWQKIIGND